MESFSARQCIRKNFKRFGSKILMPDLIEIQKNSYKRFLQQDIKDREILGLQSAFKSVFPVMDFSERAQLNFQSYKFDEPPYDVEECQQRGLTYAAPIKVTFSLIVWDIDEETNSKSVRDIKEQEVYMGDLPLMTDNGTFIINGVERVIVSQMHRSPGVFFDHDSGKTHSSGKYLFSARVIPYRGSWLDFEFDAKDILYVRIDRKRKLPVTTFLMALDSSKTEELRKENEFSPTDLSKNLPFNVDGMSREEILLTFYDTITFYKVGEKWKVPFVFDDWKLKKLPYDLINAETKEVIAKKDSRLTLLDLKKLKEKNIKYVIVPREAIIGHFIAKDYVDKNTGEVIAESGDEINIDLLNAFNSNNINSIEILSIDNVKKTGPYLRNTIMIDNNKNRNDALTDIYKILRPGEPPSIDNAENLFFNLFFNSEQYDLSDVGRVKINSRLNLNTEDLIRVLKKEDIIAIIKILLDLRDGKGSIDDIDNLANRRVRSVGELLENQYRIGLLRMERAIRERMSSLEIDSVMPHDLINAKPVVAVLREFFGTSQLSQFMDQINPLSEITHKRRLSALGPGGLTRERAGFEVRDIHTTHYGRICPVETPEGPNIGLINSLATFARVNKYGFIETPYRKVEDKVVTSNVVYLSALEEERYTIAQAVNKLDKNGKFIDEFVTCRKEGEFIIASVSDVDFMDVSPQQLVSIAASLIPFLENDDANRALMGSNMQRQAVPLIHTESPLVGTGMESAVARDSGVVVIAKREGVINQVDANRIVIKVESDESPGVDIYNLKKFQRSNQNTCLNQKPIVEVGDKVQKGDIIADGPSTSVGELALGKNVLVGFLSWDGCNFEDSIIISERLVHDDTFTSIHIEEFEIIARDTKLGNEEVTRDIPNVGDEFLRNLDETGIVVVGAEVNPGDILVGKVTPKGESPVSPEEKLLRAIFGEKASDVRDSSLKLPPGASGTVVDIRIFSRRGIEKDERALAIERAEIDRLIKDRDTEGNIIKRAFYLSIKELLLGSELALTFEGVKKGTTIDDKVLTSIPQNQWRKIKVKDEKTSKRIKMLGKQYDSMNLALTKKFEDKIEKIQLGDELPPGVLKMVKVFVAVKRKLQPGDKMAGRHGNKGVVSYIAPIEDMPYLEDGTPIDIILSPLGVPSRMNVGQILETHLGWASSGLGKQIKTLLDQFDNKGKTDDLKESIYQLYDNESYKKEIYEKKDKDLIKMANKLTKGVPMATPVFDGANEKDISKELEKAGLSLSGQVNLFDGRTGEEFERKVTIGFMYMLKLNHLVDDKIHARSIGPYSLVTQQPLGGKAQFGGQRFGEMEVWALEAYGAAYTLQEMLTIKSDDVSGRTKVYESIIRGDENFEAGIPESFNVLVKELRALSLNVEFGYLN